MLKKFFKGSLAFINLITCGLMLAGVMACYVAPAKWWWLPFAGYALPFFLLINIGFFFLWLMRMNKLAFLSFFSILLCLQQVRSVFAIHFLDKQTEQGIKIMSYNVKNFDLYNWTHNLETRHDMLALIAAENPDIICFQEFYSQDTVQFMNKSFFRDSLHYKYNFFKENVIVKYLPFKNKLNLCFGLAVFSRLPIVDTGTVQFANSLNNNCMWVDLLIHEKRTRLYNMHLQSIHLDYVDYDTIEELEENQNTQWYRVRNIIRKIKTGFVKRGQQVDKVKASIEACTSPKILCGDFNDLPVSYSYHQLRGGLQDAFVEKGKAFGGTYTNKLKLFRIDQLLFDPSFTIYSYRVIHKPYSDHYPIVVTFE